MNARPDIEPVVSDWLHATATAEGSDRVLAATLVRVAQVQQERSGPASWLSNMNSHAKPLLAVAAAATVLAVAVVGINPLSNSASARIDGVWPSNPGVAFTVELPADAPDAIYWRAAMFDQWSESARVWSPSAQTRTPVEAGTSILDVASEPFAADGLIEIPVTIMLADPGEGAITPGIPATVDQPIEIESTGTGGSLVRISLSRPREAYTITGVQLAVESERTPLGVSAAKLAAAGTDYPPDILAQFATAPEGGELGVESLAFIREIREAAGDNPYRIATRIEQKFRSPEFTYDTDMRDVDCGGRGFTECFMRVKRGYCMYYATGMIMLLRQQGIPARIVMGYLPGERVATVETVPVENAHAWVEVFFPGWGWSTFDPTPGGRTVPLEP
jgi:transglutaminase-like putative cysteine protease